MPTFNLQDTLHMKKELHQEIATQKPKILRRRPNQMLQASKKNVVDKILEPLCVKFMNYIFGLRLKNHTKIEQK